MKVNLENVIRCTRMLGNLPRRDVLNNWVGLSVPSFIQVVRWKKIVKYALGHVASDTHTLNELSLSVNFKRQLWNYIDFEQYVCDTTDKIFKRLLHWMEKIMSKDLSMTLTYNFISFIYIPRILEMIFFLQIRTKYSYLLLK